MYLNKFSMFNDFNQETVRTFLGAHNSNVARAFIKNLLIYFKTNLDLVEPSGLDIGRIREVELPIITGRTKVRIPKILTKQEIKLLEQHFPDTQSKLMFRISYDGGLRVGELLSIKLSDIYFSKWAQDTREKGEILVHGKGGKEGLALINSDIFPDTMMLLYKFVEANFTDDDWDSNIWRSYKDSSKKISMKHWHRQIHTASLRALGRRIKSHTLRHTRATHLLEAGNDIRFIQEFLRHTDISSTQIYTHVSIEQLKSKIRDVMPTGRFVEDSESKDARVALEKID